MWEFDDAVEVHSVFVDGIETPDQFLWRGRLWRVCALRSQWTETAAWWERGVIGTGETYDARAGHRASVEGSLARVDSVAVAEACSAARPARSHNSNLAVAAQGTSPAAVGVLDAEWGPQRAVYRVEAGCGRHGRRELFDLAHDPDSGRWQLERVTDR
jgi:hypothetical protein